jgi:hypothetical protein
MAKKILFKASYPWFFEIAPKPIPAKENLSKNNKFIESEL